MTTFIIHLKTALINWEPCQISIFQTSCTVEIFGFLIHPKMHLLNIFSEITELMLLVNAGDMNHNIYIYVTIYDTWEFPHIISSVFTIK